MPLQFAQRLENVETSAIRELFKLLGKPEIISFAGGFPDAAMFDTDGIKQAAIDALNLEPGAALQYGATEGYNPLREQLSTLMEARGVKDATPAGLIVTTGSQQALDLIGKCLLGPGDKVIVEAPTFLATIQCFRLYGAEVIGAPIDEDGVVPERLEELISLHKPKLVYLVPSFGNPSGAMLSAARRKQVLEIALKHRTLIVEDDPYGDLYFGGTPPPPSLYSMASEIPGCRDWVVYCGSLSKVVSPGLRIGWIAGQPELLANATMCKQFSDAHTSTFAQATAARYLASGRLPACLAKIRQVYAQRAKAMGDFLERDLGPAIDFIRPKGGMFYWARLTGCGGGETDAGVVARRAISHGVAFVPGTPFYATDPDRSTLRLSFATADEARIQEGVQRLAKAL